MDGGIRFLPSGLKQHGSSLTVTDLLSQGLSLMGSWDTQHPAENLTIPGLAALLGAVTYDEPFYHNLLESVFKPFGL